MRCASAPVSNSVLSDRIETELWLKFILLASNASMTALTRQPIGRLRDDPDINPYFAAAFQEVADVARAKGIKLPADAVQKITAGVQSAPAAMMASMAVDLIRGNRIELPWLSGKVVQLGRELGVPTPVHAMFYAMLKPYVNGAP